MVFANSTHVTDFYSQDEVIIPRMLPEPDGFYGLSKAFGEDLAQLYWDRWGIETMSLRTTPCQSDVLHLPMLV